MAASRKRPKLKQTTSSNKIKLLTVAILITITFSFIAHFLLYTIDFAGSDPKHALELELIDNLTSATKSYGGEEFSLEQIFGQSPIWGSLNSGHYFGLKLSSIDSLETGLLWFQNKLNLEGRLNIRHLCDQNDRLRFYSWTRHNFYSFGQQEIEDQGYQIKTSYLIDPENKLQWRARVDVETLPTNATKRPISLIYYVTTNHLKDRLDSSSNQWQDIDGQKVFRLSGLSKDVGEFTMDISWNSDPKSIIYATDMNGVIDKSRYSISSYLHSQMLSTRQNGTPIYVLPNHQEHGRRKRTENPNIISCQILLKPPVSFNVHFKLGSNLDHPVSFDYESVIKREVETFDQKFSQTFPLDKLTSDGNITDNMIRRLAKVALSNMIGSVGHFYGRSIIGSGINDNKQAFYGPIQLLTAVPSRSFFPRGFLWDEGFHNLLLSSWDADLSNKIIRSWFNIMNMNGWIPREVILGIESLNRVPQEFIVQRISNANPPSMFLVIDKMLSENTLQQSTLESIYPKLKKWYRWFKATQYGEKSSTFRWRGRDELSINMLNPKTLTSGLDDYPRSSHPSTSEYHVDLRCWMTLAARTLAKLAKIIGDTDFLEPIIGEAEQLNNNRLLDDLHWSETDKMYCDFGHNTEKVELVLVTKTKLSQDGRRYVRHKEMERRSTGNPKFGCVAEFGYVSLFPLMHNIIEPHSEKLGVILKRLRDTNELWSPYGIRSLSKSSKYYNKYNTEHDAPYWRGAIWLNMNYLILSSLRSYSKMDGPYKQTCAELFIELKENLVNTVLKEFSKTNYIWENYDDRNGQGKGSHPFTGWSSLILLIMSSSLA